MNVIFTILTVFVIIASVLLTLVVLLQNGKGGGLASNFVAGNQTFGVRQTADILEKITWGLVIFIFVVSVVTVFTTPRKVNKEDLPVIEQPYEGTPEDEAEPAIALEELEAEAAAEQAGN